MPPKHLIRVLLADANPTFLDAAARYLALDENLTLVGRAVTAADALRQAADLGPDLVLVDIRLPDINGLELTRQIKGWPDPPRVIVMSFSEGAWYLEAARNAGADGFVAKMEFFTQMYGLIHALYPESAAPGGEPASSVSNGKAS